MSIPEAKPSDASGQMSSESHALGGRAPNDDGCNFIVSTVSDGGCWHVFILRKMNETAQSVASDVFVVSDNVFEGCACLNDDIFRE